jgi:hypothetical protein
LSTKDQQEVSKITESRQAGKNHEEREVQEGNAFKVTTSDIVPQPQVAEIM